MVIQYKIVYTDIFRWNGNSKEEAEKEFRKKHPRANLGYTFEEKIT